MVVVYFKRGTQRRGGNTSASFVTPALGNFGRSRGHVTIFGNHVLIKGSLCSFGEAKGKPPFVFLPHIPKNGFRCPL